MPAACASSSTSCSEANVVGGAPGARSADVLKNVSNTGSDLAVTRRFGMSYCVPEFATDALPRPGGSSGTPTCLARRAGRHRHLGDAERGVVERHDPPARVHAAPQVGQHRRAVVVPAVLVPAHELQPHRRARELRHHRGRDAGVEPRRAVAERRRALPVLHAHAARRQAEDVREHACAAGRRPACSRARSRRRRRHVRDGAARADRHVALVAVRVARAHRCAAAPKAASTSPASNMDARRRLARRVEGAHLAPEVAAARDRGRVAVDDLQPRGRLDRVDSRDATTPRKSPRRTTRASPMRAIERSSTETIAVLGPGAVGALAARPHDPAVQHPGHADALEVGVGAGHLGRDVDPRRARAADEAVRRDRLRRRRRPDRRPARPSARSSSRSPTSSP